MCSDSRAQQRYLSLTLSYILVLGRSKPGGYIRIECFPPLPRSQIKASLRHLPGREKLANDIYTLELDFPDEKAPVYQSAFERALPERFHLDSRKLQRRQMIPIKLSNETYLTDLIFMI